MSRQYTYDGKTWIDMQEGQTTPPQAIATRNTHGGLVTWQELNKVIRENLKLIEDIRTRLDDIERALGDHGLEHEGEFDPDESIPYHIRELTKYYGNAPDRPEETTGTHPPDCRCWWCEPEGTAD